MLGVRDNCVGGRRMSQDLGFVFFLNRNSKSSEVQTSVRGSGERAHRQEFDVFKDAPAVYTGWGKI